MSYLKILIYTVKILKKILVSTPFQTGPIVFRLIIDNFKSIFGFKNKICLSLQKKTGDPKPHYVHLTACLRS